MIPEPPRPWKQLFQYVKLTFEDEAKEEAEKIEDNKEE